MLTHCVSSIDGHLVPGIVHYRGTIVGGAPGLTAAPRTEVKLIVKVGVDIVPVYVDIAITVTSLVDMVEGQAVQNLQEKGIYINTKYNMLA